MQGNINKCDALGKKNLLITHANKIVTASSQSDHCPWCSLQLS